MTDRILDDGSLQQMAKDHLWMHFARQSTMEQGGVPIIVRGEGGHHIFDIAGKRYFDGLSGLFVVNAGGTAGSGSPRPPRSRPNSSRSSRSGRTRIPRRSSSPTGSRATPPVR